MKKKIIIWILVLIILIASIIIATRYEENTLTYKDSKVLLSGKSVSNNVVDVGIIENKFIPDVLEIKSGTRAAWTNYDSSFHAIESDEGLFKSDKLFYGKTFSYIFNKSGEYSYHCKFNPNIKGKVIVK